MPKLKPIDITDRTFAFATRIVKLCRSLNNASKENRAIANQLIRAGTSVGANVEEAQSGQSRADFAAKIYIACKEARETNYWLRLFVSAEILEKQKLEPLISESKELIARLTAITKTTQPRTQSQNQ